MLRLLPILSAVALASLQAAPVKIAALHPLLADLARQVGKEHVEVIDLVGPNGDPHTFQPAPEDLKKAEGSAVYLVSGMGLEGYLPKLKNILAAQPGVTLVDVGSSLPAIEEEHDQDHDHGDHDHDHDHHHSVDPHWWHSIDLFRRATTIVAGALAAASPEQAEALHANAEQYREKLDELERWVKREIAAIPRANRHLATAHAAFNYFCRDFGFTPHPVQGINREQMPDPKQLADLIADLKKHQVVAIFPEKESNPKILQTLTKDTGIRLAEPLIADGRGVESYESMIRRNVEAIVAGLKP